MSTLWNFIRSKDNRERLGWLGGGAVVVIAGLWTAFVYFFPAKPGPHGGAKVEASCGSIAVGRDVKNSNLSAGNSVNCSPKQN